MQAAFLAQLSVSLLSYADDLVANNNLDRGIFSVLNVIWFTSMGGSLFIAGVSGLFAARRMVSSYMAQLGVGDNLATISHRGLKTVLCVLIFLFFDTLGGLLVLAGAQMQESTILGNKTLSIVILAILYVFLFFLGLWIFWILRYHSPTAQSQEAV